MAEELLHERSAISLPQENLREVVLRHLKRLLHSPHFDASTRSRQFLCHVIDEVLAGRGARLDQTAIAMSVFGRRADFDAILDPIVRVQAGRLRRSLERYYLISGDTADVRIELPKGGYEPVFTLPGASESKSVAPVPAQTQAPWPTIVIHPVSASAQDADQAAQFKDELVTELCRYGDLRVVRQSDADRLSPQQQAAMRFELRPTLRREGDDCRLAARLCDRSTAQQIWSDEYHTSPRPYRWSGGIDDLARVIAARVGSEYGIIARLLASECTASSAAVGNDFSAIARCHHFLFSQEPAELSPAIEALRDLTSRAAESAIAWACLARLYLINYSFRVCALSTPIENAIACAYQAVTLDPASPRARCILAASLLVKDELYAATEELEQALRINYDSLAYREIMGWLLALAGDWNRGIALMRESMERNPYCVAHVRHGLWADHLRRGEYASAHVAALEYRDAGRFWRELMLACSLGHLGRLTEARAAAADLLRIKPQFAEHGRTLIGYYIKPAALRDQIEEGLYKAGVTLN